MSTVISTFIKTIQKLGQINPDVQVAPSCILWPDGERQFENVIPQLQEALSSLLILGDYFPEKKTGPAIWLRCVIDGTIPEVSVGADIPVIYMPGVTRSQFRLVEQCPDSLKPLLFFQYRGVFFSQYNGKDWTVLSYLKSKDGGGLKLDVATDDSAKNAMLLALPQLMEQDVELLKGKRLDKDFFNKLIAGGDPVRDILQWLDKGDAWRTSKTDIQWKAFVELCKSNYAFNPEMQGHAKGLELFANRQGVWKTVYERYEESYHTYPKIPKQLKEMKCPEFGLFATEELYGGWPQWNEYKEKKLAAELEKLINMPLEMAHNEIVDLEKKFAPRRETLWGRQGLTPMADSLEHLAKLAILSQEGYLTETLDALTDYYDKHGYIVDEEAWKAVSPLKNKKEREIAKKVVQLFYQPWLEKLNNSFLSLLKKQNYRSVANQYDKSLKTPCCYVFVDGLRLDHAHVLKTMLEDSSMLVAETYRWAPIPTMTANGKPAAVPAKKGLTILDSNLDFDPLKSAGISFDKYLLQQKIVINGKDNDGVSWKEFGDMDKIGHEYGGDMPLHIHDAFRSLLDVINDLFQQGYKTVRIVTDHGWLWVPLGLPKTDLPVGLTDGKWGRYAVMKSGAKTEEIQLPWHWNKDVMVAFPSGICAHRVNMEYAHGGLSLQECRLLELTVTEAKKEPVSVNIVDVVWKGLRCRYRLQGNFNGCAVAIRRNAVKADEALTADGIVKGDGTGSILVEDDSLMGQAAYLVVINNDGNVVAQKLIAIGAE